MAYGLWPLACGYFIQSRRESVAIDSTQGSTGLPPAPGDSSDVSNNPDRP